METIISFILPPTFPPDMVPEETGKFMLSLVGKPIAEAMLLAEEKGLNPRTGPLPNRSANFREFSIYDPDMGLIPFGCRVTTQGGQTAH